MSPTRSIYAAQVKLEDAKRRHQDLQLRLLRVLRKVEVLQAKGAGLQPEEERWKSKLQQMQRDLNSPTQYKARLNELASLVCRRTHVLFCVLLRFVLLLLL